MSPTRVSLENEISPQMSLFSWTLDRSAAKRADRAVEHRNIPPRQMGQGYMFQVLSFYVATPYLDRDAGWASTTTSTATNSRVVDGVTGSNDICTIVALEIVGKFGQVIRFDVLD